MKKLLLSILILFFTYNIFSQSVRIRKDWSELTTQERADYINALDLLDDAFDDEMAQSHVDGAGRSKGGNANIIHHESQFMPWHRLFIYEMENRLRATGAPNLTLPYWDWYNTWDENSELFGDGLGNNDGLIGSATVTGWNFNRTFPPEASPIDDYFNEVGFTDFSNNIENGNHNLGHRFVGGELDGVIGTMATSSSPNDPVFYIHHAMVDREWSRWVKANPSATHYVLDNNMETFEQWDNGEGNNVNAEDYTSFKEFNVWYAIDGLLEVSDWTPSQANSLGIGGQYNFNYTTGDIEVSNMIVLPDAEVNFTVKPGYEVRMQPGLQIIEGGSFHAKVE